MSDEKSAKKPMSKDRKIVYGMVIGVFIILCIVEKPNPSTPASTPVAAQSAAPANNVAVGDIAYLRSTADPILVPTTQDDFNRTMQLSTAGDTEGISQMVMNGEDLTVSNGTKVKVISESFTVTEVRIMSGDDTGRSGFVPNEFVSKN